MKKNISFHEHNSVLVMLTNLIRLLSWKDKAFDDMCHTIFFIR